MEERRPKMELLKQRDEESARSGVNMKPESIVAPVSVGVGTGAVLDGKYLVGEIIGSGAFGIVYEGKNLELDEKVALKVMRPEVATDKGMVGRFAREAKSAASIKSEYAASVFDVGSKDGVPYIVMEYLEGKSLGQVVEESGPFPARTAVEYALQVCEALAVAHSKGIIHRDIKPENLLLTERSGGMQLVKVLDFGISKAEFTGSIFGSELPIVKTMNLMGTPLYMSPEQVRCSDHVDVRSDIWSLGMVLYEILAGNTAFEGTSIPEICAAILETQPKPIEVHRNDLPAGLVEVIAKCLEKDQKARYQNVAELAIALMPFGPKRSRLNVERAVSVLQGAGQVDPTLRVESMFPPSSEAFSSPSIPRSGGVPSLSALASSASDPALPSTAAPPGVETLRPPSSSKSTKIIIGVSAAIFAIIGIGILVRKPEAPPTAPPTSTTITATPPKVDSPAAPTQAPAPPEPAAATATAAETAAVDAHHAAAPVFRPRTTQAPAAPVRMSVTAAAPPATPPAPTPVQTAPAAQPAETATGRTFRRSL